MAEKISNVQVGACGIAVGLYNCPCEDYNHNEEYLDAFGEPQENYCECGHHRAMHLTIHDVEVE